MRKILFRGKTDKGEWVVGNLMVYYDGSASIIESSTSLNTFHVILPETVGQYTGLTDKNGKKIFEGDIIKQEYYLDRKERAIISVVEYGISYGYYDACGVYQRFRDGSGTAMLSVGTNNGVVWCEVIGNIYDNPELLKGENNG